MYSCDNCGNNFECEDSIGGNCPLCGASCIRVDNDSV